MSGEVDDFNTYDDATVSATTMSSQHLLLSTLTTFLKMSTAAGDGASMDSGDFHNNNESLLPWPASTNQSLSDVYMFGPDIVDDFGCKKFLPVNHFYFQLANTFFFLSYLAPNGIYGILYLRITLAVGSFFFALWGYVILCALDTMVWNCVFFVINFIHACFIIYQLRPINFPPDLEGLYKHIFLPLRVSRLQFRRVLNCMKEIQRLKPGETFAAERETKVDKLSLVLSGRFMVSQDGKPLNFVTANQFLDSPEWFGMSTDEYFQVTIIAVEDGSVLVWNRDKLKLTIDGDAFLQAVFDHILGKDVVNKLMQVNETCLSNGAIPSIEMESMEKPRFLSSRMDGIEGITGSVNRHIQDMRKQDGSIGEIEPLLLPSPGTADTTGSLNNDLRETDIC